MAYTTINKSSDYFNGTAYTGNGTAGRDITLATFQPDFTWIKSRSDTDNHRLVDAVRGATKHLQSDTTDAEQTSSNVTAFTSDGVTLSSNGAVNANSETYMSWNWLGANGTTANTDGSTATTVSVNTTAGFSIGTYTGTSAVATMGHGLGAVPGMIIVKNLSSGTRKWAVWHQDLSSASKYLSLNETSAELNDSAVWNNTLPTNLVFSSAGSGEVNQGSQNFVFYAFSEKQGYSKFGSYVGNGNANGTFVYTGFKPAFVITKASSASGQGWHMQDNKRDGFNYDNKRLFADSNSSESGTTRMDLLSNGFKYRDGDGNGNGISYIYMAFAEAPLVGTNGVTAKAR